MKLLTVLLTLGVGIGLGAQQKAVVPASGPAPVGPYSPGVIADGYLYVSGQGAKTADGQMPATLRNLPFCKMSYDSTNLAGAHIQFSLRASTAN